jgi:hypothetical protein
VKRTAKIRRPAVCLRLRTYLNAPDFDGVTGAFWKNFSRLRYIRRRETCRPLRIATNVAILCAGLDCCFVWKAEVMSLCTTVALVPDGKCHAVHDSRSPGIRHGNTPRAIPGASGAIDLAEVAPENAVLWAVFVESIGRGHRNDSRLHRRGAGMKQIGQSIRLLPLSRRSQMSRLLSRSVAMSTIAAAAGRRTSNATDTTATKCLYLLSSCTCFITPT